MEFTASTLFNEFKDAWRSGMAPDVALYLDLAADEDRDELAAAIGAWLATEAPSTQPHPERAAELAADPLVQRLAALETDWWENRPGR